jgi:tRNA(Ile)-lysidine synthase
VSWGPSRTGESVEESFEASALRFPLVVRGWRAGDRVRLPYGEKKLKKLLLEARVPASDRGRLPVLADGDDTVLWVPGVARSMRARPGDDDEALFIRINDASYD